MFGILAVDKPIGWTSRQAVNWVQRLAKPDKVGHAGTLDPLASGVLVVCIGPATRLIEFVQQMPKRYAATFRLGCSSPSDDLETEVVPLADAPIPSRSAVEAEAASMIGVIRQRPPSYSAVKVQGERSYRLARRGEAVELEAREVEISSLTVVRYDYPELELQIACSGGTYVRSLGRDLAALLGTQAVMTSLERTAVGDFLRENCVPIERLDSRQLVERLQSPLAAIPRLAHWPLTAEEAAKIAHGQPLRNSEADAQGATFRAAIAPDGQLVAILMEKRPGLWFPARNFARTR